jgi:hypothetical protein
LKHNPTDPSLTDGIELADRHRKKRKIMTTSTTAQVVSRRTALAGISAAGLGLALAATTHHASAQDATPTAMAGHPVVGTWIIDRDPDSTAAAPTLNVFTADGGIIDPVIGVGGLWQATGPRTLNFTLVGITAETLAGGGAGSYVVIRGSSEVDDAGESITGTASVTVVAADGTVLASIEGSNRAIRLHVEPENAGGTPLAGFPAWTPATPTPATPTS